MSITQFKGDYFFLSNFSASPLAIQGVTFPTVEHYYQAMKSTCYEEYLQIATASSPGLAKKLGKKIQMRSDWDQIKDSVMRYAVYLKFQEINLRRKLIETENKNLIEGNFWNDSYWGVDLKNNKGLNKLGIILMDAREYYKKIEESQYVRESKSVYLPGDYYCQGHT